MTSQGSDSTERQQQMVFHQASPPTLAGQSMAYQHIVFGHHQVMTTLHLTARVTDPHPQGPKEQGDHQQPTKGEETGRSMAYQHSRHTADQKDDARSVKGYFLSAMMVHFSNMSHVAKHKPMLNSGKRECDNGNEYREIPRERSHEEHIARNGLSSALTSS